MTPLLKKRRTKETVPTIDVTADSVVAIKDLHTW